MSSKEDFYQILGVSKTASDDEIKKAYRNLAKKYHPDANPDNKDAEMKFNEIGEAYSVLNDSTKRQQYDQFGHSAFDQSGNSGGYSADFDMGDIFSSFFGGSQGGRRQGPRQGADLQTNVQITFEEAFTGCKQEITIPVNEVCKTCDGTKAKPGTKIENCGTCRGSGVETVQQNTILGAMMRQVTCRSCHGNGKIIKDPCTTCRGAGKVRINKKLEASIPAGIDNGQTLRISGKGEAGEPGAPNGDLLVTVYVLAHKLFVREGNNIKIEVPITFVQASIGGEITIPTMEKETKQIVKAGTQSGTIINLRGKGFPSVRNNRVVGDIFVTLKVSVPTSLTEKQKQILLEFAEDMGEDYKDHKKGFLDKIRDKIK